MGKAKNILFIMFDQLRWDYLSCYGHPHLQTPNIDRLAKMGVRFTRAIIQSPICGSSRMSTLYGAVRAFARGVLEQYSAEGGEQTRGRPLPQGGMGCCWVAKTI